MHLVVRILLACVAVASLGCGSNTLHWHVRDPARVSLDEVPVPGVADAEDEIVPHAVLAAGGAPSTVVVPYRGGTAIAERSSDGSLWLRITPPRALVEADGSVAPLRTEDRSLSNTGAWALLDLPPPHRLAPTTQLRLSTPRDNVDRAWIEHRRNPVEGWVFVVSGTIASAISGTLFGVLASGPASAGTAIGYGFASVGAGMGLTLLCAGIYELVLREYDEVLR